MKIAFLGLGKMGAGMARNLIRAGHELTLYNRSIEKAREITGARVADSPAEACRDAEAAISMLADDHAVEVVVCGDRGIAAGLPEGAAHICSATISTAMARRLTALHENRRQAYLSAPVFGRPQAAEAKKLIVVPAGSRERIEKFEPLFEAIGGATFIAGSEPWQANAVKLCGNFMIASMLEAFSEAFATLRKAGVDPGKFLEIVNALFQSPVYANYGQLIVEEKFEPAGFALKLGLKDVRLVLQTAEEMASPMPLASAIRDRFLEAMAHAQAEMDWSSVAKSAARQAGLT
ncbi:MAG TPA: NAD(P)-dependent oxidoreductase [Bryobacteraceae bacterium]|jgi:3-hydroxyisobutyrate dehydrogenase-like beta-hydroxyacid dehydrogenase|nr:NAD(P)-dependent oxidoreductase [Bryobacteraceae bacterium]